MYITATNTAFLRAAFPGYDPALTQGGDELDLLRSMRHRGRTVWVPDNPVSISPRRLQQGLLYSILVSLIGRYLLAYVGRRLVRALRRGPAPGVSPASAPEPPTRPAGRLLARTSTAVAVATVLILGSSPLAWVVSVHRPAG